MSQGHNSFSDVFNVEKQAAAFVSNQDLITYLSASQEVSTHWQRNDGGTLVGSHSLSVRKQYHAACNLRESGTPVRRPIAPKTQSKPSQTGVSRGHRQPLCCDCWRAVARVQEAALTSAATLLLSLSADLLLSFAVETNHILLHKI